MKRHSKDAFSREPEVGVVTAKTTRYHTNSTQVSLQKSKKQKGPNSDLYHRPTISSNFIQTNKIFQQSVYTVGPPHDSQEKGNTRLGLIQSLLQIWKNNADCLQLKVL